MFWFSDKSHLRTFVLFSFLPSYLSLNVTYRKIPKISPGSYTFQRPFLRGLFLDGLIFVGAYVRREVCVSKSIGLAYSWKEINRFCFVLLCIWGQFSKHKTPGGLYWEGRFHGGFFVLRVWGSLYMEGLISEFYGSFSMGFKYGRIPAVSKAHLLEFWMKYWSIF